MKDITTKNVDDTAASKQSALRSHPAAVSPGNPFLVRQQQIGNQAVLRLMESGGIQTKLRISQPGDADELEADRIADHIVSAQHAPTLQRKCACGGSCSKCANNEKDEEDVIHRSTALPHLRSSSLSLQRAPADSAAPSASANTTPPSTSGPAAGKQRTAALIVDDDASSVAPTQMRKSQFVALLQTTACATADAVLASVRHTTKGCPYVKRWLNHYKGQDAQHVTRAMYKYAPETQRADTAHEAISLLNQRIHQAAVSWVRTGKVSGVPPDLQAEMIGGAEEEGGTKTGEGAEGGSIQRKAQNEARSETGIHDAGTIKAQLGSGHSLDSRVQNQMSSAFGYDFSGVRVHTDSRSSGLSAGLQARAFTIGEDVAFAAGEYQPGTLIGDALIAHELAHVVQQGGGKAPTAPMTKGEGDGPLEEDADRSAIGAVLSSWSGLRGLAKEVGHSAVPRLKSGLRLQRCRTTPSQPDQKSDTEPTQETAPTRQEKPDAGAEQQDKPPTGPKEETPLDSPSGSASAPSCIQSADKCAGSRDSDTVICDHQVSPDTIEKPGDKVNIKVTFACEVLEGKSIIEDGSGTSLGSPTKNFSATNTFERDWDGKKLFGTGKDAIGTFVADDGDYRHRLDKVKYGFRFDKKTKKSNDVFATGPKLLSDPIKIKSRQFKGPGTDHFHYTAKNAARLADIIESEMSPSVAKHDDEMKAIAWAVRNQMVRSGTADVETVRVAFGDSIKASPAPTSGKSRTIAEEILKKPMSDDITSGAIKWFSPQSMPKKGETCGGTDCRGGLISVKDLSGKDVDVFAPSFHKTMTFVSMPNVHEWLLRLYKL